MNVKRTYFDTLQWLEEQGVKNIMNKKEAQEFLGIGRKKMNQMIDCGSLNLKNNQITIGSIAAYLCD